MLTIKEIRRELGISQDKLAELIGVTRTYVSLLENGARNPSPALMWKIESLLSEKEKQKEVTKETSQTIPVVGMAAAASFDPSLSNLCDLWECSDERVACVCKHADQLFGVRISGDSMAPTLLEGDVVAVSDTLPATGDICIVRHRTEGVLCKKWYWRNGVIRLDSINPEGKSFEWTKETFSAENPIVWRFRVEALIYRKLG